MQNHVRFGTLDDHLDASVRQIIAFIKDTCLTSISMAHRNAFLTGLIRHLENLRGGAAGEVSENFNIFCIDWIISYTPTFSYPLEPQKTRMHAL